MPKTPIDYSKTIIYKICCKDPTITDVYVGHTTDLIKRRYLHKSSCCNPNSNKYHYYIYEFIRNNGGWDNWDVIMIEECNLNNHNEALKKERWWLEELKATLNKNIPLRDMKEWHKDNKEHEKIYRGKYYDENKDILLEKAKIRKKIYYYKNVDKILENFKCICGGSYINNGKSRHLKTKKHEDFITSQNSLPSLT